MAGTPYYKMQMRQNFLIEYLEKYLLKCCKHIIKFVITFLWLLTKRKITMPHVIETKFVFFFLEGLMNVYSVTLDKHNKNYRTFIEIIFIGYIISTSPIFFQLTDE